MSTNVHSDAEYSARASVKRSKGDTHIAVKAGKPVELRMLLQTSEAKTSSFSHHVTEMTLTFVDAKGRTLDARLERGTPVVPDLFPATFEIAPEGALSDAKRAAAEATRLLLAPPDASHLIVSGCPEDVSMLRLDVHPLSVSWAGAQGRQAVEAYKRSADLKFNLAKTAFGFCPERERVWKRLARIPVRQAEALCDYFRRGGDWAPVLAGSAAEEALDEHDLRLSRLRSQVSDRRRVGFIGSQRGRERLLSMCDVTWLREEEWRDQIAFLDLDLIVIEAVVTSGARGDDDDWQLAFSSLEGDLPPRGSALFDGAATAGIPIHLWFTGMPDIAGLWAGAMRRSERVVAEGEAVDWSELGLDHVIRRATEPASCSVAHIGNRPTDLMLIPVASDVFQFPEFNEFINHPSLHATLLSEVTYGFDVAALSNRLPADGPTIVVETGRAQQRMLMQAARVVLLAARSLRSDAVLAQIAIDSIASGAIPVIFGRYDGSDDTLSRLDSVMSPNDLVRLQALWRVSWLHQRRWRELYCHVMRDRVWRSDDRAALLGRDPFPNGFDRPRVSAVMATKRPHLVAGCLDAFRRQSWPETELILVFNTGAVPPDLPELRDNEHAFALPEAATIGECLNRGIARATGRYWAKMDDDDFYSATYLEETAHYYRSAQADVVGRQATGYYFAGEDLTRWRPTLVGRCWSLMSGNGHISGATLSGDRRAPIPGFSVTERNSVDSSWVRRVIRSGHRVFSGDSTSMIVYRDGDEARHTWKMSAMRGMGEQLITVTDGRLSDRLDP